MIEQSELTDEVELIVNNKEIILRSFTGPRQGWEKAFREMNSNNDDELLDVGTANLVNDWDEDEWTW